MVIAEPTLGPRLAEGKTKIIFEYPRDPDYAYMVHKDDITAGDGAKHDTIAGKGELSCRTTSACFRYLEARGLPTHYVDTVGCRTMIVRRAQMLPIEWVARRIAAGSYVRRTGVPEGTRFDDVVLELFFKDDAQHDPFITPEDAINSHLCTMHEMATGLDLTWRVFLALEEAWQAQDIQLVDLKIELGRRIDGGEPRSLIIADVIDNDSWRLWPGGRKEHMLDKQVYRDLAHTGADALEDVRHRYVEVAERVERFVAVPAGLKTRAQGSARHG